MAPSFPAVFCCAMAGSFVADYPRMPEGSANPARRWTAAVIAIVAALWFCYAGGKHALASHYAVSSNPEDWERATRIEPDNPEIWYQLGRFRQLDFDNADLPLSISDYRRAIQLNPRSPYYKLDLAGALEMAGNNAEADSYFRAPRPPTRFPPRCPGNMAIFFFARTVCPKRTRKFIAR